MREMATIALSVALSAAAASAQSVVNGDFSLEVPRNGSGNGWTSSSIDFAGGWSGGGNPGQCFVLNDNGGGSDPTLAQLIDGLTVGRQYEITGDYASWHINGSPPGGRSFRVRMGGTEIFLGATTPSRSWTPFSAPFVATSTSMLLELQGEVNGTDNDFAVDNIGIVPAPASAALFALAALAARRRR